MSWGCLPGHLSFWFSWWLLSHYPWRLELSGCGQIHRHTHRSLREDRSNLQVAGNRKDSQRCAYPRRISITPNPTQTTAVTRNVGTYSDPSHAMYAERASCSGFIQIPHIPKTIQTRPKTKQIHCSITTIVAGRALFRSSPALSLTPCPTLNVRSRPRCPTFS